MRLILLNEPDEQIRRQALLVLGEQRPSHPLDDGLRSGQNMRIDDQACLRIGESDAKEQPRICLGREYRPGAAPTAERRRERLLLAELVRNQVRSEERRVGKEGRSRW